MRALLLSLWRSKLRLILTASLLLAGLATPSAFGERAAAGPMRLAGPGGGEYRPADVPDLTDEQRQAIWSQIDRNIQRLGLQRVSAAFATSLGWPVRGAPGQTDYGYHGISGFMDHDSRSPNYRQDWNCGTRTYDTASGYNHKGTDFFTWPFGWYKMDNSLVEVVAAASGVIVYKHDGEFDRSCSMNGNQWNAVYIWHDADGSIAWYGHLKKNSVTSKNVGDSVAAGEYLGIVGSSGSSTGPHLHFELYDSGGNLVDPWAGTCNPIASWWAAQRPYYDSAINKLTTGSAPPVFPSCPTQETPNTKDQFSPGDTVYYAAYYRDQRAGQVSAYTIYKPDGSVYDSWTAASSAAHYSASYWYWWDTLSPSAPGGLWKFEVVYNEQTYQHLFSVGNSVDLSGRPADHALRLDWTLSGALPAGSTWQIAYAGPPGDQPSPVTGLPGATRAYTLTGLTNYAWYTVTLNAVEGALPVLTDTVSLFPTDLFVYLPSVVR